MAQESTDSYLTVKVVSDSTNLTCSEEGFVLWIGGSGTKDICYCSGATDLNAESLSGNSSCGNLSSD